MQELFLKRHFEEKEVVVFLVVDVSRSMRFSTAKWSKRMRAVQVAATLGFSAAADNCHLGFMAFSDKVEAYEPPRKGQAHVWRIIDRLYNLRETEHGTNCGAGHPVPAQPPAPDGDRVPALGLHPGPDATQLAELPGLQGAGPQARCRPDRVRGRAGTKPAEGPRPVAAARGGGARASCC